MEEKNLICIGCPMGCLVTVHFQEKEVSFVTGNTCPRGADYAIKEVTNPRRIVTTTVRITGGTERMLPVKTKTDIPKKSIFACIKALKGVEMKAPVHIGDVILENVAETGVDIVAAKEILPF